MTFRKWKVVARDVNHKVLVITDRCWTKSGAGRVRNRRQALVPIPLAGKPLYRYFVERAKW